MIVTPSPDLEAFVQRKTGEGGYRDASAVIEEALRLLEARDAHERLRAELQSGFDQIERAEVVEYAHDFMERMLRESREHVEKGLPIRDVVRP